MYFSDDVHQGVCEQYRNGISRSDFTVPKVLDIDQRAQAPAWVGIREAAQGYEIQYCCEKIVTIISESDGEVDPNWVGDVEAECEVDSETPSPHLSYTWTMSTSAVDGQPDPSTITADLCFNYNREIIHMSLIKIY